MVSDSVRKPRLSVLVDGPIPEKVCKEKWYPDKPSLQMYAV